MKKKILSTFLVIGLLSCCYWIVKPLLTFYLTEKVQNIFQSVTNDKTSIESITFDLVPLSLKLNKFVADQPTNEIESLSLEQISLNMELLNLLQGKQGFLTTKILNLNFKLNAEKIQKSEGNVDIPLDSIFQWSRQIPLASIEIENLIGHIFSFKDNYSVNLNESNIHIDNFGNKIKVYVNKSDLLISQNEFTVPVIFNADLTLRQDQLEIVKLSLLDEMNVSFFDFGFNFLHPKQIFYNFDGSGFLKLNLEIKKFENELQAIFKNKSSIFSGRIQTNLDFLISKNELDKATTDNLEWTDVKFKNWHLGSLKSSGNYVNKTATLNQITINHPALKINDSKIIYNLGEDQISTNIKIDHFDLQNLFTTFNLSEIPVWSNANSDLICNGKLRKFYLDCKAKVQSDKLMIKTDYKNNESLVLLNNIRAEGVAKINATQIELDSKLGLGKSSQGAASGVISFKDGFYFKFNADSLKGTDIENLAGVGLFGDYKINGETKGTSSKGVFHLNIDSTDSGLYKTRLGNVKASINYQNKQLQVENISATSGTSSYSGAVALDFENSKLKLRIASTNFNINDTFNIIKDLNLPLPNLNGIGVFDFSYEGALNFNTGSVNSKGYFSNLIIGKEKFNSFEFEIKDEDGKNKIKSAKFIKNRGTVSLSGYLTKNFEHQIEIFGRNLFFEESQTVTDLFSNIAGVSQFDVKMNGPFFHPEFNIRGTVDKLIVSSEELENSEFDVTIKNKFIDGKVSLFANQIVGKFGWPLSENTPFYTNVNLNNWNFSKAFALFGSDSVLAEYKSNLNGTINLRSETGLAENVFGKMTFNSLLLSRNQLQIKNVSKMELEVDNGTYQLKNWNLSGDDTQLEISSDGFRLDKLNLKVVSKLNMRLLQIFLPFLNDIAGRLQSTIQISGNLKRPEVLGDAKVINAFVKPKALPHSIEKINISFDFSQSKIDISKISAELGGGTVSGQGQIDIIETKKLNTIINLSIKDVNLNIPDRFKTLGDGDLTVTGNWFPYLLSGSYRVKDGFIDKEFGSSENSAGANFSVYLPKNILEIAFEPILLDLKIQIQKPLVLKNSILDAQVTGDMQVKGFPSQPRLIGQLQLKESSVLFFRDVPFEITSSNIDFKDEVNINPNIYVSAKARKSDYDVTLLVQGPALSLTPRATSVPPLSEQDIFSLLAFGTTRDKLDQKIVSREQESNLNYAIGSAILANNPLTKNIQKKLGIELQFSTNYDNTKNVAQQKATVSKKVANKITLSASQTRGEQLSREATIQYSINPQLSAIGIWENKDVNNDSSQIDTTKKTDPNIFGIDLEFKREFK